MKERDGKKFEPAECLGHFVQKGKCVIEFPYFQVKKVGIFWYLANWKGSKLKMKWNALCPF